MADGKVVTGNHEVYRIQAKSRDEMLEWVKRIRASIASNPLLERLQQRRQRVTNRGPIIMWQSCDSYIVFCVCPFVCVYASTNMNDRMKLNKNIIINWNCFTYKRMRKWSIIIRIFTHNYIHTYIFVCTYTSLSCVTTVFEIYSTVLYYTIIILVQPYWCVHNYWNNYYNYNYFHWNLYYQILWYVTIIINSLYYRELKVIHMVLLIKDSISITNIIII